MLSTKGVIRMEVASSRTDHLRHCRQPKLPTFLYSSNTTSWRFMRRANNDIEGDRVFDKHWKAAAFVLLAVKSHSCSSWRYKRLCHVGQHGLLDSGSVDIVAVEESQQFSYFSADSVRGPLHQS